MAEPFTDEELEERRDNPCHGDEVRYLTTIDADRQTIAEQQKKIEELRGKVKSYRENVIFKITDKGQIEQLKCNRCASLEAALEESLEYAEFYESHYSDMHPHYDDKYVKPVREFIDKAKKLIARVAREGGENRG